MDDRILVNITYSLIRYFLGPIVRLVWIKKISGIKKIPSSGSAILAFNHQSYFDFICFVSVSPRNVHYLSAEKFFSHPFWNLIMKITGQIRVDRLVKDKHELHESVHRHIDEGKILGIFPEGARSPHRDVMLPGFPGVIRYAIQKQVPVIPIGIKGTYDVLSRHDSFPKFKKVVEIAVGNPIFYEKYYHLQLDKETLGKTTHELMLEISKLSNKQYPHVSF